MMANEKIISGFTEEVTSNLSGVSIGQLRSWRKRGLLTPSLSSEEGIAYGRIYSFLDVAALRVLNALRNESRCKLDHLIEVSAKLAGMGNDRWTRSKLGVLKQRVNIIDPETDDGVDVIDGQTAMSIALADVISNLRSDVAELNTRDPKTYGKITQDRYVLRNVPVIAGTRIPVSSIMEWVDRRYNAKQIVEQYPDLVAKDVEAAVEFTRQKSAA